MGFTHSVNHSRPLYAGLVALDPLDGIIVGYPFLIHLKGAVGIPGIPHNDPLDAGIDDHTLAKGAGRRGLHIAAGAVFQPHQVQGGTQHLAAAWTLRHSS